MELKQLLLGGGIVSTGLIAGLFYGWSVSVIRGTRHLDSPQYVNLMQHVNREILTPRFLVPFIGTPLLSAQRPSPSFAPATSVAASSSAPARSPT